LYERLFEATRAGMQELQQVGVVRPALDERLRGAFLLGNDLFPRLTGRQHIAWFGRVRGGVDHSAVKQLADRSQVVTDHPVRELSKGSRQKIGLVLAFMHRPELLFSRGNFSRAMCIFCTSRVP
jgi:beta-exotoxin I transport system ATP-binding protein